MAEGVGTGMLVGTPTLEVSVIEVLELPHPTNRLTANTIAIAVHTLAILPDSARYRVIWQFSLTSVAFCIIKAAKRCYFMDYSLHPNSHCCILYQ